VSSPTTDQPERGVEERLERGEVVFYPACPFGLPREEDHQFLLAQELGNRGHKNISYTPRTGTLRGFRHQSPDQAEQLRRLLADFSRSATEWLTRTLPRYAAAWQLDQVSFRPQEESTRQLRLTARNDLLHVDAFPNRPTGGARILRLFVNLNPSRPRVWVTAEPFALLLRRFAADVPRLAEQGLGQRLRNTALALFRPGRRRSPYDAFMLRFHDLLKADESFQEHAAKQHWSFPPGSVWLAMTDTCSHAVLGGRYALEHSYFVAPRSLTLPHESPSALLERACGRPMLRRAA
jgi:hypothetical protein